MKDWKRRLSKKHLYYEFRKNAEEEHHKYVFENGGLMGGDFVAAGSSKKEVLDVLKNEIDILTAMLELIEEFEHPVVIEKKDNE